MPVEVEGGTSLLQGFESIVVPLIALHLLALVFWIYKLATEPSGNARYKSDKDKE